MIDRLRRPRKSIFKRPIFCTAFISYWVMTARCSWPFFSPRVMLSCNGTYCCSGSGVITMPAAWVDACRTRPSSLRAFFSSRS